MHLEYGVMVTEERSRSIKQVTSPDSIITYCRPKDMIGDSVSMTGKVASVVGKWAKFEGCFLVAEAAGIAEIVGVDTLVVAASASWKQLLTFIRTFKIRGRCLTRTDSVRKS